MSAARRIESPWWDESTSAYHRSKRIFNRDVSRAAGNRTLFEGCVVTTLTAITYAAALATHLCFAGAMRFYFRSSGRSSTQKKWMTYSIYAWTLVFWVVLIAMPPASDVARWTGVGFFALAQVTFWWAIRSFRGNRPAFAFTEAQPLTLNEAGPYAYIRHPFYTSYILGWLGAVFATGQPWLLIAVAWMSWFYVRAAQQEERTLSNGPLGASYRLYQSRTGMFWPKLLPRIATKSTQ